MFGLFKKKKAIDQLAFCLSEKLLPFTRTAHTFGFFWERLEGDPYLVGFINSRIRGQMSGCKALVEKELGANLGLPELENASLKAIQLITQDPPKFIQLTSAVKNSPEYAQGTDDAHQVMRWYAGMDDIRLESNFEELLSLAEAMQKHIEMSGLDRLQGSDVMLACWAAECQLFGLRFDR